MSTAGNVLSISLSLSCILLLRSDRTVENAVRSVALQSPPVIKVRNVRARDYCPPPRTAQ